MAAVTIATEHGIIEIPRQFDDQAQPRPACIWAVQVWAVPPAHDGPAFPISMPYHATGDAIRVRDAAAKLLPRWELTIREVWVAQAITHDDAVELFKRWRW